MAITSLRDDLATPRRSARPTACPGDSALRWDLKRNCSLTPAQSAGALLLLGAVCAGVATAFAVAGYAWVTVFSLLELAALAAAWLFHASHACDRDSLTLRQGRLVVEERCGTAFRRTEFDAAWVRVECDPMRGGLVELSQRGQRVAVGRHAPPQLRSRTAMELRRVLAQANAGLPRGD